MNPGIPLKETTSGMNFIRGIPFLIPYLSHQGMQGMFFFFSASDAEARPPVRARTEPRVPLDHLSLRCEKQVDSFGFAKESEVCISFA